MKRSCWRLVIPTNVTDVGCVTVVEHQLSSNVDVIPQEMRQEENLNALSVVSTSILLCFTSNSLFTFKRLKVYFESCRFLSLVPNLYDWHYYF